MPAPPPSSLCRSALWALVVLVGSSGALLTAQVAPASAPGAGSGLFALPWEVTFAHIERAMSEGSYQLVQARRILDRSDPRQQSRWVAIEEVLKHRGSATGGQSWELQFLGLEGKPLSPEERARRTKLFSEQAGFLHNYQSFHVSDAARAGQTHSLMFLGVSVRLQRPVYRMAVFSVVGPRTGWLVELDAATGYPLYRGEYDLQGRLVSEVEVKTFDPAFGGAVHEPRDRLDTRILPDPETAFAAAGVGNAEAPAGNLLPPGFAVQESKVVTNPYTGAKRAIVVYSDGVGEIFLQAAADGRDSQASGHTITTFRDPAGITQCTFVDGGVQYVVIGRDRPLVKALAAGLYAQVAS